MWGARRASLRLLLLNRDPDGNELEAPPQHWREETSKRPRIQCAGSGGRGKDRDGGVNSSGCTCAGNMGAGGGRERLNGQVPVKLRCVLGTKIISRKTPEVMEGCLLCYTYMRASNHLFGYHQGTLA